MHTQTTPTAREIMSAHVHCIEPATSLQEVVDFMLKHEISNAPVVERAGNRRHLLGFVSEADCLEFLSNEMFYGNPSPAQTAEKIMKKHPTCVGPDADIFALTSVFMAHGFRHLPVVDSDHDLLGIVSRRDILASLSDYYRQWNRGERPAAITSGCARDHKSSIHYDRIVGHRATLTRSATFRRGHANPVS